MLADDSDHAASIAAFSCSNAVIVAWIISAAAAAISRNCIAASIVNSDSVPSLQIPDDHDQCCFEYARKVAHLTIDVFYCSTIVK